MTIGQELLNVPMGDMIRDMAFAIADSQFQLDQGAMRTAEMMGGLQSVFDEEGNQTFDDSRIFFGYEYMTVKAALAFAIFDDSLTGAIDADTIRLKDVVIEIVQALDGLTAAQRTQISDGAGTSDASVAVMLNGVPDSVQNEIIRVPTRLSMMELGFTPTFYQFVDTIIEVKIAIKITRSYEHSRTVSNATSASSGQRRFGWRSRRTGRYAHANSVQTTQVDASYSAKYSYSAEGASLLRTKLAPVPPPAILEERIRTMVDFEDEQRRIRQSQSDDNV